MSRGSSPSRGQAAESEENEYQNIAASIKRQSGFTKYLKFVPFGLVFSAIGIMLYVFVGGVEIPKDVPYIAAAYGIGVIGLTSAYSNVASWVVKERSRQIKDYKGSEHIWFSLFYNNAFYIFLLLLGSHIVFSTLQPTTSLIITQILAVAIPAWMPSLSK